jgi:hypothetical protein
MTVMHGGWRRSIWLGLGLGLLACGDDVTVIDEPSCIEPDRHVDVHFLYNTGSLLESDDGCELTSFGPWGSEPSNDFVSSSCSYSIELDGVSVPTTIELEVGDAIEIATSVDDPEGLGCAENGWLSIEDTQGRMQLAALSVAVDAAPLSLGDLGEVEIEAASVDGCKVLRLRAQGDEATVPQGTSTEIELAGARLLVQLGIILDGDGSCPIESYSVVMFRLPD